MKNQASGWCRSVDVLGQRPKARPSVSDRLDDYQKVLERSAQAIVFRDNYNVTGPQLVKETVEFRPIQLRAGDLLTVDPFSPGRLERFHLGLKVLASGRDPCVAQDHDGPL
jgi:hypothetical protein